MGKEKEQDYTVERVGAVEYVVVRCPNGHVNRGLKVGEAELSMELVCAARSCGQPWTQKVPHIMSLESES